ncbi:hypothetical protein Pelo_7415 [Pelomyxa schiedti]|nr:hypothetical protein Pelo_7415 [Pelomyxa schiedti]
MGTSTMFSGASGKDSDIFCWGENELGQLGLGDYVSRSSPILMKVEFSKKIKSISCGAFHSVAVAWIRARDQVAALLLATHPRCCGVRSGRKGAVRLTGQAVRRLWDDWVMGCVRMFAIESKVSRSRSGPPIKQSCCFSIGISMLLMGITHELVVMEATEYHRRLDVSRGVKWVNGSLHFCDELRGIDTSLVVEMKGGFVTHSCVNSKWFVACCYVTDSRERRIVLGRLPAHGGPVISDAFQFSPVVCFVSFNKFAENEALLLVESPASEGEPGNGRSELTLWTIDVAACCSSRILTTKRITKWMCSWPSHWIYEVLPMKKSNGKAMFIASFSNYRSGYAINVVQPNGAQDAIVTSVADTRARGLSQLSVSLFCVLHNTQVLIWDCNNLQNAISCIQVPKIQLFMVGLGFFLKLSADKKKIHVIEASSDMKSVATVEFLLPGCSFGAFVPRTSHIW